MLMASHMRFKCAREGERGEIASWVLVLLMSVGLVVAVFGLARERLLDIVSAALSNVCGGVGC